MRTLHLIRPRRVTSRSRLVNTALKYSRRRLRQRVAPCCQPQLLRLHAVESGATLTRNDHELPAGAGLASVFSRGRLREILTETERNDPLDQVVRHGLIDRELEIPLRPHVWRQRSLETRIA